MVHMVIVPKLQVVLHTSKSFNVTINVNLCILKVAVYIFHFHTYILLPKHRNSQKAFLAFFFFFSYIKNIIEWSDLFSKHMGDQGPQNACTLFLYIEAIVECFIFKT